MTRRTFYKWLGRAKERGFSPYVTGEDEIRLEHKDYSSKCFCPITAVCYMKTGSAYDADEVDFALDDMGCCSIDDPWWDKVIDSSDVDSEIYGNADKIVRKTIIRRLGLKLN